MSRHVNILSLFDGLAAAYIALHAVGIGWCTYYASEIDKHAIQVACHNYTDIIQLGDIHNVKAAVIPQPFLLIGGSPCQNLSCRGDKTGLRGEKSGLFFEYVRLLRETQPKYFLLENVASMSKKNRDIISSHMHVDPIMINSHCFVPQTRRRYYWTNIPVVLPPDIPTTETVQGILEANVDDKFFYNKHAKERSFWLNSYNSKPMADLPIARPLKTQSYTGRASADNCYHVKQRPKDKTRTQLRRLTPREYEKLQGIPVDYTAGITDTHRYKLVGNSFTVPVIEYILSHLNWA